MSIRQQCYVEPSKTSISLWHKRIQTPHDQVRAVGGVDELVAKDPSSFAQIPRPRRPKVGFP